MDEKPFKNPEEFKITDKTGKEHTYVLSEFDAVTWRKIFSQYPLTALPKIGDYAENEKLMIDLMSHVAVLTNDGRRMRLETMALINNHVPYGDMLAKLEIKMMGKNYDFFQDGKILTFFDHVLQIIVKNLSETLMLSLEQSSVLEKQLSTNFEQSTPEKMPS